MARLTGFTSLQKIFKLFKTLQNEELIKVSVKHRLSLFYFFDSYEYMHLN